MNPESKIFFNLTNIRNLITDYYRYNIKKTAFLRPLLACYLVNYDCNYACSFCSRVAENTFTDPKEGEILRREKCYRLLRILRDATGSLYLSGGEPLLHPDIVDIALKAKELGFKPVSLNTNASLLHCKMEILQHIDILVVSLHTLNVSKMRELLGISKSVASQAINNIRTASQQQDKYRFKMIVNTVIGPDRIDDVYDIIEFCNQKNVGFSVTPQMKPNTDGCFVERKLIGNTKYQELIDYIIRLKKEGQGKPLNSFLFLDIIRDLNPYPHCIPFLLPCISPNGGLYYPCPERKSKLCENILEAGSYEKAFEKASLKYPGKSTRCPCTNFKPGNIEPSILVGRPMEILRNRLSTKTGK